MRTRTLVLVLAVGALIVPTAPAASAVEAGAPPALVSLGTLGGDESNPTAVNDRGQVVGVSETADGAFHAFLWEDGTMIDLAPTYASSVASDINNKGQVVLQRSTGDGATESVLWSDTRLISLGAVNAQFVNEKGQVAGTMLNLDDPAAPNTNPFLWDRGVRTDMGPIPNWAGSDSRVVDFNDKGAILGIGLGPESFEVGFVWSDGVITPVGDPTAFGGNGVVDITNRGMVLGADFETGAFLWESGVLTHLGSVPGRGRSEPAAVNEAGWVAGTSLIEGGDDLAFLWRDGVFTIVGPAGTASRSVDINDKGQIIGMFSKTVGGELSTGAFLWYKGELFDLGEGLEEAIGVVAISEKGHIIGTVTDASGASQAMLWTTG